MLAAIRHRIALAGCVVALAAGLGGGSAPAPASPAPNTDWTSALPPFASPNLPQPRPVRGCRRATMRCIQVEIKRLRALRDRLGCDHRAVFATTYLKLTKVLRNAVRDGDVRVRYLRYLYREDALFANVYFDVVRAYRRGEPVPEAWRISFETAAEGNVPAAQDMLLGINAHVQNDMPFVLASLGLRTRKGKSRKVDHDALNEVLNMGYEPVVRAVRRRFDPSIDLTNPSQSPIDDLVGLEAVRGWREVVWRNAERLVNADDRAERRRVAAQIEDYAASQARLMSLPTTPGYGAQRDAYCTEQLGE